MGSKLVLTAVALLIGACAEAPSESGTVASASAAGTARAQKICRQDPSTGSLMRSSICYTKAEWAAIDAQDRADAQRTFDNSRSNGRNP